MGLDEKNRSEVLSRIMADLFVQSKGGEELSVRTNRLRDEIKKVVEGDDTIYGKFRGMVESFREVIPEEKQRYNAAIKALSTTSKLSRQEIVAAVNNQLDELKLLEKGVMPSLLPGWRDDLRVMEARSKEMGNEITKLREILTRLESEEKGIVNDIAARKKDMELVEKAVGDVFTVIGAEITHIKKKVEEFSAEPAAPQPVPQTAPVMRNVHEAKESGGQASEPPEAAAPPASEFQKKCPMCGGRMDFYSSETMWQCYVCAYEESEKKKEEFTDKDETMGDIRAAFESAPASDEDRESPKVSSRSSSQPSTKKKTCPACRKKMIWYDMEGAWRCTFCEYETRL